MGKTVLRLLAALLGLLLLLGVGVRQSPEVRSKTYSTFSRVWQANWPFSRGVWFPIRFRPLFAPLVPVRVQVEPGVNMLLDPNDLVSRWILESGHWEPETWAAIEERLPSGGTFVDVGAHIGYHSLKAARLVGPTGRVIAVEPNPETIEQLRDNVRASRADVVELQPFACSDTETDLELYSAARANSGVTSISRNNAGQAGKIRSVYTVRARPLDAILQEISLSQIDVIKIDVEGAELLVLRGSKQTLAQYKPVLFVEVVERQLRAMGASTAELTELLGSLGYNLEAKLGDDHNWVFSHRAHDDDFDDTRAN